MIKTTTTEESIQGQERSSLSTLLQFPGKSHTEGASILEAKRLLDEEGCSAVSLRTQLIAGPSKTMLGNLNTKVFNKEMQGKTQIYVCQRNVYAIIHTKKVYCVSIRNIISIFYTQNYLYFSG